QTLIYGLSTIMGRLLNFVLTPLLVRKFPAAVYGVFTNLYAWAAITNAILAFGMETTFFRYLQKHENKKEKVYSNTFFVILCLTVIFVTATVLFADDIATWILAGADPVNTIKYIHYFVFILAADAMAVIPFAQIRASERPLRYGLIKVFNILIFVSFTIFFIFFIPVIIEKNLPGAAWMQSWYQPGWIGYVF